MTSNAGADAKPPVNYVFVDYENVHDVDLSLVGNKTVYLTLLLGARQTKLDAELVEKLMENAASVQLVRLNSSGRNALDFALSYYLGKAASVDPTAYFHIVSRDTGFDSLIEHLRSRHIKVHRHSDYASLTFSAPPKTPTVEPEDLLARVIAHLKKSNRPTSKKRLVRHLFTFCGKTATGPGIEELIHRLCKGGYVTIEEKDAVTYQLDPK